MSMGGAANGSARRADGAFVLAVWSIATIVNLFKPVHVDDAAHLAIARHILADPLHPMRGTVFWGVHPQPIFELNQPHLFFYVLAGALALSGGSLIAAHFALALTILPGIAAFHATARHLFGEPERAKALAATALVFLGPGFLPGQNLMCDAPLVSLVCVALWALVTAEGDRAGRRLVLAGVALGLACLVKYTALALLPVFGLDAWKTRDGRRLATLAIPIALLGAYAVFNVFDYGGVHVLERHPGGVGDFGVLARVGVTFARAALFVLTLGSITFAIAIVPITRRALTLAIVGFVVLVGATRIVAAIGPLEMRDEPWTVTLLRTAFFVSGVLVALAAARSVDRTDRVDVLLGGSIVLLSLFVVVLSPFVAVRHALLVLPSLTLLLLRRVSPTRRQTIAVAAATLLVGLTVAASDHAQAAVYRDAGQRSRERSATPGRTWFVGHWGWQWYARDAGLEPYDPDVSILASGDTLIRPSLVDAQPIAPRDAACLSVADTQRIDPGPAAIARTITSRQGYYAVWQGLPYGPSAEPLETFTTYRVTCFAPGRDD